MSEEALLWLIVAVLLPTGSGVLWVVGRRIAQRLGERRREPVAGPPVERVAADLRRLHAQLAAAEDDRLLPAKQLRCRAIRAAYLDTLVIACKQLGVAPPTGHPVPRAEIYRVEAQLRQLGLEVRDSR